VSVSYEYSVDWLEAIVDILCVLYPWFQKIDEASNLEVERDWEVPGGNRAKQSTAMAPT
jgi:hypothetical protein